MPAIGQFTDTVHWRVQQNTSQRFSVVLEAVHVANRTLHPRYTNVVPMEHFRHSRI